MDEAGVQRGARTGTSALQPARRPAAQFHAAWAGKLHPSAEALG